MRKLHQTIKGLRLRPCHRLELHASHSTRRQALSRTLVAGTRPFHLPRTLLTLPRKQPTLEATSDGIASFQLHPGSDTLKAYRLQARHLNLMHQDDICFLQLPGWDDSSIDSLECHLIPLFQDTATGWHYSLKTRRINAGPPMVNWPMCGMSPDWVFRLVDMSKRREDGLFRELDLGSPHPNDNRENKETDTGGANGSTTMMQSLEDRPIPELCAPLGALVLASPASSPHSLPNRPQSYKECFEVTPHATGYILAVDILDEDLSLWILREDLDPIRNSIGKSTPADVDWNDWTEVAEPYFNPINPANLFDGQLLTPNPDGRSVYGVACIMSSFRNIGQDGADYGHAVDLVKQTRHPLRPGLDWIDGDELRGRVCEAEL